jgi:hypothetical protein
MEKKGLERYQNGKIYKIVCNITGKQYIGSTCKTLSQRLSGHKSDYKRFNEGKSGNTKSFDILKEEDYDIVLIEVYPCNTKDELHKRERHYIETWSV